MPDDAGEQVIEVVSDTAGQLPDGLRALGAHQALLELPAVGDVGGGSDVAQEGAVRAEARHAFVQQPAVLSVMTLDAALEPDRPPAGDRKAELLQIAVPVLGVDAIRPPEAELGGGRPAGELEPAAVHVVARSVRRRGP